MALASGSLFNIQASATTGNTGGAGFNPANTNFPTDLTTNANTANTASPIVSSATYTFVSPGDVGAAVYIKSGTSWTPGFYLIASVSGGKATLSAAIGAAWQLSSITGFYEPSTVVGCATVGTPTAGTFGVNYAMQDTANSTITDAVSVGSSTTLTSTTAPWTPVSVGNFFHLTTAGTGSFGVVGWYEIVTYTSAGQVTTDRTTNNGTALAAGTGQTGGAGRLNGLEDTFQAMLPSASMVWAKNGSYTLSGAISTASTNSTSILPSYFIGYNTVPGDTCTGSNRPLITAGANAVTFSQFQLLRNLSFTSTGANGIGIKAGGLPSNCRFLNTSTTTGRNGLTINNANGDVINNECISQNGVAISGVTGNPIFLIGNYIHDSDKGVSSNGATTYCIENIIEGCVTSGIANSAVGGMVIMGNTIYGREAKTGIGLNLSLANAPNNRVINNIFYGLTTAITVATGTATTNISRYNDFFNNTTDATNWYKGVSDLALDPQFTGATQITGTTATTSGSVLTQAGGDFSTVTDNVDFLHVTSGTGVTTGCYLITSHSGTTLTVNNALGTSSGGDVVYWITTGHNFQIGTNLKGLGFQNFANVGSETTSYPDVGAVQRQEPSASGGGSFTFVG